MRRFFGWANAIAIAICDYYDEINCKTYQSTRVRELIYYYQFQ